MKTAEFKQKVESITYQDVLKLRETKAKHALKLEELEITLKQADEYVEVIKDFLQDDLNFNSERIEAVECRRRGGYCPHSYNKGGIEAVTYRDQYSTCQNTGFKNTDEVLAKYSQYALDAFKEENPDLKNLEYCDWSNEDQDRLSNFECEYSQEDTIQFQARIMMTSETTANVDLYVSVSDSPYHRQSDDKLEIEISFKSPAGMKRQLKKLLKNKFLSKFKNNVLEGIKMKNNRELFKETYAIELEKAHKNNPDQYAWPISEMSQVLSRMFVAIDKGSFNKDSLAFKATCKALKIKHTYRDIETFLGSQGAPQ